LLGNQNVVGISSPYPATECRPPHAQTDWTALVAKLFQQQGEFGTIISNKGGVTPKAFAS